jgi:hypothetical protein
MPRHHRRKSRQQTGMNEFARHALIRALLGAGGAAGGSYYGGRQGALEGAVLGLGLPKAAGTLMRAPFVQSYLKNQLSTGAATSPAVAKISALAAALAGLSNREPQPMPAR